MGGPRKITGVEIAFNFERVFSTLLPAAEAAHRQGRTLKLTREQTLYVDAVLWNLDKEPEAGIDKGAVKRLRFYLTQGMLAGGAPALNRAALGLFLACTEVAARRGLSLPPPTEGNA